MYANLSLIKAARFSSAMTSDDACAILGMSKERYEHVEEHPLEFTIGEIKALYTEFNSDGKELIRAWISTLI